MTREISQVITKRKEEKTVERGKNNKNIITITMDEDLKIKITVEGLWNGKDRHRIGRMLLREMRTALYKEKKVRKQADQKTEKVKIVDPTEQKRMEGLKKYWAAKKLKKLEEEKDNVRGQRKPESK